MESKQLDLQSNIFNVFLLVYTEEGKKSDFRDIIVLLFRDIEKITDLFQELTLAEWYLISNSGFP